MTIKKILAQTRKADEMFNLIQDNIIDSVVLDLFAGSGQLGIEALSRGAKKCYFCDIDREDIIFLKRNIEKTHLMEKAEIFNKDFKLLLETLNDKCDLIFIDPPYKSDYANQSIEIIHNKNLLNKDGLVVIETDETQKIQDFLNSRTYINILKTKNYGRVSLFIISFQN